MVCFENLSPLLFLTDYWGFLRAFLDWNMWKNGSEVDGSVLTKKVVFFGERSRGT